MKNYKSKLVLIICSIIVLGIIGYGLFYKFFRNTYSLSDYGVSISVPIQYSYTAIDKETKPALILDLKNYDNGLHIQVSELRGKFWSSDDLDEICDEYLSLMSAMKYGYGMSDVSHEVIKQDFKEVGKVTLRIYDSAVDEKAIVILTPKSNGYLAIEIYGSPDNVNNNMGEIEGIIKSIKFSKNTHDYSNEVNFNSTSANLVSESGDTESGDNLLISGDTFNDVSILSGDIIIPSENPIY